MNKVRNLLITLFIALAVALGSSFLFSTVANAISCGVAQCSVSSEKRGQSNWEPAPDTGSPGSPGSPGSSAPRTTYSAYFGCSNYYPQGGGQSLSRYPDADVAGNYVCSFKDGGYSSGGNGTTFYQCLPQNGRAANGRYSVYDLQSDEYLYYYCAYPTDAHFYPAVTKGSIYIGGSGYFYSVLSANQATQASHSGVLTDSTGYRSTGYDPSNPRATPDLDLTFNAKTGFKADGTPLYSPYRLFWETDKKDCVTTQYPPIYNKATETVCGATYRENTVEAYTYSCELSPALQAGNHNVSFKPSACADDTWECFVSPEISINGVTVGTVEVMRNGADVPTVHNGGQMPLLSGSGAVNPRSWKYKDMLLDKSSPANTARTQFWSQADNNGSKNRFGAWQDLRPEKQNMNTRYLWASDPASGTSRGSWAMTREYMFTADFIVTTQAGIGSPTVTKPVTDTADCGSAVSPNVLVLRSINADTE